MNNQTNRLLIVDDEPGIRDLLATIGRDVGFLVRTSGSADETVMALKEFRPKVLILDLNMPGSDGIELLRYLANEEIDAHILLISGEDKRVLNAAERLGSSQGLHMAGTLQKPIMIPDLESILARLKRNTVGHDDLWRAVNEGEFRVHYQPQLTFDGESTWSINGAEALVRWQHPERGLLMPGCFIPVAEESGLIGSITDFVLREIMEQNRIWLGRGLNLNISVNISPQLLTDVDFPDRLSLLLNEFGIDGSMLTLEITETVAPQDLDALMDSLTRLRLKGIELAIDDFGTGYSSMKQLFCMPFTELKIDRSFVLEVPRSEEARTMVSTMINLADNLNMTACAEGVESQEVLDFLELCGCHSIQGFFISKPVPAGQFEEFLRTWKNDGQRLISMGRT